MNMNSRIPKTTCITDDYNISDTILGSGSHGEVVECYDRHTGEKRALKVLVDSPNARREVQLHWLASDCFHVVKIIDVYENTRLVPHLLWPFDQHGGERCLLIVMECMSGGELYHRLEENYRRSGRYDERQAAEIMLSVSEAVRYLHERNIAHRDIKLENFLYTSRQPNAVLKLTDFGFAKRTLTQADMLQTPCFTPYYVAPEVLYRAKYDKSCDIWSMGVLMYILLCGFPPFDSCRGLPMSPGMQNRICLGQYTFSEPYWSNVSAEAKNLIQGMLVVDPGRRLNIHQVMASPWIRQLTQAPQRPLNMYTQRLAEHAWAGRDEMTSSMAAMEFDCQWELTHQVMASPWIRQLTQAPQRPLYNYMYTQRYAEHAWAGRDEMTSSMAAMETDCQWELTHQMNVKPLSESNNALLMKRWNKDVRENNF